MRIGVSIWSATDALGSLTINIIQRAADALGCSLAIVETKHISKQVIASVSTLISEGCTGVMVCNSADSEMPHLIKACNKNSVYLTQFYRAISQEDSPQVYQAALDSPYYVGAVHEDEVRNGETLAGLLIDGGRRHICLEGWTEKDATFELRWRGYRNARDQWNATHEADRIELSEPIYVGVSASESASAVQRFEGDVPSMDALIVSGGGGVPLVGAIGQLKNMGLTGKVAVATTDFLDNMGEHLSDGSVYCATGGNFCDALYAFILTYQACTGKLQVSQGGDVVNIQVPYVRATNASEYAAYKAAFLDEDPYSTDEMRHMAELTPGQLAELAASLSIEEIRARHGRV